MPAGLSLAPPDRAIAVTRHASDVGWWEMAVGPSAPALQRFVASYCGWLEQMTTPLIRRELPTEYAPLMFSFGAPIRLCELDRPEHHTDIGSFITGAYDRSQLVGSAGLSGGVQVNLTLLGIRRLVGVPLESMKNRAVSLDDVFGPAVRSCIAQVEDATTWSARFAVVDRFIVERLAAASTVPPAVRAAWQLLAASAGQRPIREVAAAVGWSQKHLIAQFRHEIGLSPKELARLLRFGRVVSALKSGTVSSLADVAIDCGYYDQSHLNRDSRAFAGVTPGELIQKLLPDSGGIVA